MDLINSIVEFFSTVNFDELVDDLKMIVEGIDFQVIADTFNSLVETIKSLFA